MTCLLQNSCKRCLLLVGLDNCLLLHIHFQINILFTFWTDLLLSQQERGQFPKVSKLCTTTISCPLPWTPLEMHVVSQFLVHFVHLFVHRNLHELSAFSCCVCMPLLGHILRFRLVKICLAAIEGWICTDGGDWLVIVDAMKESLSKTCMRSSRIQASRSSDIQV